MGYYENIGQAEEPTTNVERFQAQQEAKASQGTALEALEASASDVMAPFALYRMWERRPGQFEDDPSWEIDDNMRTDLMREYNKREVEELERSSSESEFLAKKRFIHEDRDRMYAKSALGIGGSIVADMTFSLFDPIAWGMGGASTIISRGTKATGMLRAAQIAAATGAENAVLDTFLSAGDTQHEAMDTVIAFAGGAAIGGAIGAMTRSKSPKKTGMADEADDAFRTDAENFVAQETLDRVPRKVDDVDTFKVKKGVDTHEAELKRAAKAGHGIDAEIDIPSNKNWVSSLEAELNKIKARDEGIEAHTKNVRDEQRAYIKEVEPERQKIREGYSQRIKDQEAKIAKIDKRLETKDTPKQQAKLWQAEMDLKKLKNEMNQKIATLEAKLKAKVNKAEYKLRRATNKAHLATAQRRQDLVNGINQGRRNIHLARKAKRAKKELEVWEKMTPDQKARHVFGDEMPSIKAAVAKQTMKRTDPNLESNVNEVLDIDDSGFIPKEKESEYKSVGASGQGSRVLHRLYDLATPVKQTLARFAQDGANVPKALEGWSVLPQFTKWAHSPFTRLSKSENLVIRGLNYHLLSAGQGGPANPAGAASVWSNIYQKQFRSALKGRIIEGMEMYRKANGHGRVAMALNQELRHNFYKRVELEVRYPGSINDPGVQLAAEGVRDFFETAGQAQRAKGVKGFENLEIDRNYISTIVDENRIATACRYHGKSKVRQLLSLAYQQGEYKLPKETADYVAAGYVARSLDHSLKMTEFPTKVKNLDIDRMTEGLRKAGVDEETIESFISEAAESNLVQGMSDRAKKSFKPDLRVELNGLSMIDLIDSDVPKLIEAYAREAAGGCAMARLGFKTRREAKEFLAEVKKDAYNQGMAKDIDAEVGILDDCIDMIYGRSIEKDASSGFVRNMSRLRDATAFLRLFTNGVSTIPEIARITGKRGLGTVLEAVPDAGIFGTKGMRAGKKWSGELTNPKIRELEDTIYVTGEDHILNPGYLRIDNIEESAMYKSLGGYVDACLAKGRQFQEVLSAFRYVQGSGERFSLNALASKMKRWADDEIDLDKFLTQADINDAGWHDGFLDEVKGWMQANPKTELYNGKEMRLFNAGKMPIEMRERLVLGLHQLTMRDMQRPMVGELPLWMNKWFGSTLTQFKSFSLLSLNKQLIHDIRHDQMAGAIVAMHSMFLAYLAHSIKTANRAIGRKDSDKVYEQAFSPQGLTMGIMNNMGQLASVGIVGDLAATLGAMPESMISHQGSPGFRPQTATSIPALGALSDVAEVGKDAIDVLKWDVNPSKTVRDLQKVVPFGKAAGINQALNAISGSLE